jgi:hypothetical protein
MPKKKKQIKRGRSAKSVVSRKAKRRKSPGAKATLKERIARAKKLEALDAGKTPSKVSRKKALAPQPLTLASHPLRNDDFPQTYIQEISVSLDDPDHWLTLTWAGPNSNSQETGPFRTSPGAGL